MRKTEATIRITAALRGNVNRPAAEIIEELAKEGMTVLPRQVYSAREVYRKSKIRSKLRTAQNGTGGSASAASIAARLETTRANKDKPLRHYIIECLTGSAPQTVEEIARYALNNGYITKSEKFDWAVRKLLSDMEKSGGVIAQPDGKTFVLGDGSRAPKVRKPAPKSTPQKSLITKDRGVGSSEDRGTQYDEFSCLQAVRDLSKKVGGLDKLSKYVSFLNDLRN